MIVVRVNGHPAPQGSKTPVRFGRGPNARMGMRESSRAVGPWREAVRGEVQAELATWDQARMQTFTEDMAEGRRVGIEVVCVFRFRRPRDHYRNGGKSGELRAMAPLRPTGSRNDVDKLARSTLDALVQGGLLPDDGVVADLRAMKAYCVNGDPEGATIQVRLAEPPPVETRRP